MENIVIVATSKIDAVTYNIAPKQLEHSVWGFRLPDSQTDVLTTLLTQLDNSVRDCVNTVIVSSGQGDSHVKNRLFELEKIQHKPRARPRDAIISTGSNLPLLITKFIPTANDIFQIEAACASSLKALELASMIARESPQVVLLTAIDFSTAPYVLYVFNSVGAVATGEKYYSPFDTSRAGFAMGEGAALIGVCTASYAREKNLPVLAVIDAVGSFTQSNHATMPAEFLPLSNFLENLLTKSNRKLEEFAYWDAHATATPVGDQQEYEIFSHLFESIPISSYKGHIGHCLAACGMIEIVNAIEHLQQHRVPSTHGIISAMVDDPRLITSPQSTLNRTFIKCSFGFAGRNAAIVITVE